MKTESKEQLRERAEAAERMLELCKELLTTEIEYNLRSKGFDIVASAETAKAQVNKYMELAA